MLDIGAIVELNRVQKRNEANMIGRLLQPLVLCIAVVAWSASAQERGLTTSPPATAPPPPAAAAPDSAEEVVRFDQPLKTGPPPVNGRSLEQLVQGVPLFPPIEGLDESIWKKNCSACHKWDRRTLCEQGATYLKDPKMALRGSHPYGGPEKVAIMQWAKTGCQ
jgi:hypothetical protein